MSMTSFYGGPPGQSFSISKIFSTRYGVSDSLSSDILLGWTSSVGVGEFVVVSYGLPGDPNYETLRNVDLNVDSKSYNFTLWQKCYDEDQETFNGLYYQLVGSLTGNTPRIKVTYEIVKANVQPSVTINLTNPDTPVMHFKIPRSQILSVVQPSVKLNPDEDPYVVYSESDIDHPTLQFHLPVSQVIKKAEVEEVLVVGEAPTVNLDTTASGTLQNPVLKFKLPASQEFLPNNIKTAVENANTKPSVVMDNQNKNQPTLTFHLPQAQVLRKPQVNVVDSVTEPSLDYNESDINKPLITFSLPRAPKFFYGDQLEDQSGGQIELEGAEVGDFYINESSGNIHKATAKDGNNVTFTFQACVQAPLPTVSASGISPYTGASGEPVQPSVDQTYSEETSQWQLVFKIPKAPTPDLQCTYLPSGKTGSAQTSIKDADTIQFTFSIPKGTRIFSGQDVSEDNTTAEVEGAEENDVYINSETGVVYALDGEGTWQRQDGSIKGPVGDALNIVRNQEYMSEDVEQDTLEAVSQKLEEDFYSETKPSPEDIIAVTYKDASNNETSYWYFYTKESQWGRVQLTGGLAEVIETVYQTEALENKVYSVSYINSVIGGDSEDTEHSAYSKKQVDEKLTWNDISSLIV